jgi:hypothetical protein
MFTSGLLWTPQQFPKRWGETVTWLQT